MLLDVMTYVMARKRTPSFPRKRTAFFPFGSTSRSMFAYPFHAEKHERHAPFPLAFFSLVHKCDE